MSRKTAAANFFYSDLTDGVITKLEDRPSKIFDEIRRRSSGEKVGAEAAAMIVTHLSSRTAHIRQTVRDVLAGVIREAKSTMSEPSNFEAIMGP